jgi:sterol desaturase/sphingolipid hydroxylase (fatty acid hydroxylase superfamily)
MWARDNSDRAGARKTNFIRRKTDYGWIALMFVALYYAGHRYFPGRTSPAERAAMHDALDVLAQAGLAPGGAGELRTYATFWAFTALALSSATYFLWVAMAWGLGGTPTTHLSEQLKTIRVNFLILPAFQTLWDFLAVSGYTKVTMGNLSPGVLCRDCFLWMLMFELTWYVQHRAMHDNKFLWKYGHQYHHGWKRPEHMIGITNFAFDHVVEVWVTMSSAFVPVLFFPINFYAEKLIGFAYMMLAVLVHHDNFPLKYHLQHHYLVVKNYGSHWPLFDMLFGTWQWDTFHPDDKKKKKANKKAK